MSKALGKHCFTCKQYKRLEEYPVDTSYVSGRARNCKVCKAEKQAKIRRNAAPKEWDKFLYGKLS